MGSHHPVADAYTSPQTVWNFDENIPATEGKNVPVISDQAEYDSADKSIKFPAAANGTGTLTLDLSPAVKSDVEIEFDTAGHSAALGQQYIYFTVTNSEGDEIVSLTAHPYAYDNSYAGVNKLLICGEQVAVDNDIAALFGAKKTHIKLTIDYTARKVKAVIGSETFNGTIPAKTMKDLGQFRFWVSRNKTAGDRYISLDNLSVKEFTSTETPAGDASLAAFAAATYGGVTSRVKAPTDSTDKPLVIFLSSKSRFGTDNEGQLYQAQYFFDQLADDAILAAPQTETSWNTDALKAYIAAAKEEYSPSEIVVIGYDEGATAAYSLSDVADKIIPISGGGNVYGKVNAKYWAFGGFLDDTVSIADIRKPVNALQTAGAKVRYTEYPTDKHNILEKASNETGVIDWIKGTVTDKKVVDLVLFAGQSNMAGRGDYTVATECPPGEGFEFHSITNPKLLSTEAPLALSIVSEPFGKNDNNEAINDDSNDVDRRSGDMVSSVMKAYYDKTSVPIVGVQASRGGEPSSYFTDAARKTEMLNRYNAAAEYLEQSGYVIRKKFMVWCQGESDAEKSRTESSYKTNTRAVFDNVKTAGITDIFMIKTGHRKTGDLDAQYIAVNGWQQDIIDANSDVYGVADLLTDEYKEQMIDNFHYPQAVYNEVGTTVGEAIAEIYKDETIPPEPEETEVIMPDEPDEEVEKDKYEITSSDAEINVASLINYGADTYRVYKADKSYEDVKAVKNKLTNPTDGEEVTVVPIYRFSYAASAPAGYTSARGAYTEETGYGINGTVTLDTNGALPSNGTLRVALPVGRYDISVLRQGGTRFNVCNDSYRITTNEGINTQPQNRANDTALLYAPQILNEDGTIDLSVTGTSGSSPRIATVEIIPVPDKYKKSVVWVAGDSESANYYPNSEDDLDSEKIMRTGFGMMLPKFLSQDKYKIANMGEPSATVKMWSEGNLESVIHNMDSGDTILIDFGINEAASSSNKLTSDEMKAQMELVIDAAREKNATPILVSPVLCGKYQDRAYFTYKDGTNDMYDFADFEEVACIDINKSLQEYVKKAAEDTSKAEATWKLNNYYAGDNLHLTQHSALLAASYIAAGMKELGYETTDYAYTYTDILSIGDGGVRGTETENTRTYSVANAESLAKVIPASVQEAGTIDINGTAVTIKAETEEGDEPILIHVVRSGSGVLQSVQKYDLTFNKNNKTEVTTLSLNTGDELYVWSSLSGMKPLAGKKPVTGISQSTQ